MSDHKNSDGEAYEPPKVEAMPATDGPAVTAAGDSPPPDEPDGPEWRPTDEAGGKSA